MTSLPALLPAQSEVISKEVATVGESLQSSVVQVKEVKTQLQGLEIELQSQLSMVRTSAAPPLPPFTPPVGGAITNRLSLSESLSGGLTGRDAGPLR